MMVLEKAGAALRRGRSTRGARMAMLVPAVAALAACGSSGGSGGSSGEKSIALVTAEASITYYNTMRCGAEAAAKQQGLNLIYEAPKDFDATEQEQLIQSVLLRNPAGLIVVPASTTALNDTLATNASKMPVMTTDLNPSTKIGLANIESDGYQGGVLAADHMASQLAGKHGTILVLANQPDVVPVVERAKGFIAELKKKAPGLTVLPIQYSGGDPSGASKIVSNTLQAHPDLIGVFASFEPSVLGTVSALAGSSAKSAITVVGYDADTGEVQDLRTGAISALVVQEPYQMGYRAVTEMSKVLDGKLSESQITYKQRTPLVLATRQNMNEPSVKRLFYSLKCS